MAEPTPPEGVVSAKSDADGIVIVRILDAPRELVFKAWTEPERFATWFGEHGSSIPLESASMDPRPGGAWSALMIHGPEKIEIPFAGTFGEVTEPKVVELLLEVAGEAVEFPEVLRAEFRDLGDGRTEMTFTQRGSMPSDDYSRAMRGSLIFFDRLAEHLADELKSRHDGDTLKARHDTD